MSNALDTIDRQWLHTLAYLYIQQQQTDKAITVLEALLVIHPKDIQANKMLALSHLYQQQYQQALSTIDVLFELEDNNKDCDFLWLIRSKALWGLNKPAAARDALRKHDGRYNVIHQSLAKAPATQKGYHD